jgi:hypothetical protein
MNNNLTSFVEAIAIARETKTVIKQNISLAVIPNLAALGLATTVGMHPLAATVSCCAFNLYKSGGQDAHPTGFKHFRIIQFRCVTA